MNSSPEVPGDKAAAAPTPAQAKPSNRILLVDDDISIREVTSEMLAASGYQVDTAEDGVAGWKALHGNSYDLLITDHNMPKVTGVELVRTLRSARMALPVVLVSGAIPTEELRRNPSLQLAATLLKPFSGEELLRTVEKVLHSAEGAPNRANYFPATPRAVPRAHI